jgi:putative flippase GtrA
MNSIPNPGQWIELTVLTLANLAATAVKFLLFRLWVFRRRRDATGERP